jgi:hypothetical protein
VSVVTAVHKRLDQHRDAGREDDGERQTKAL